MKVKRYDFFGSVVNNIHLEILEHGFLKGDSSWKFFDVNSPFSRLYFISEGEGRIENENGKVVMKKGGIYLIPLHSVYNYLCDRNFQMFYIHFRLEVFGGRDIFESSNRCMLLAEEPFLNPDKLEQMLMSQKIEDMLALKSYFFHILSCAAQNCLDQYVNIETDYKYQQVYAYFRENCFADVSVKELAENMNMSVSGLEKSFRQDTGETLKNYMNRMLMEKAKEKLLLTDLKINEIAALLKFSDEFYFSRYFKKHAGIPPRQYRLRNKIS